MLSLGVACAFVIALDLLRGQRQHMWIMNLVWPVTALFGTGIALWAYLRWGRLASERSVRAARRRGRPPPNREQTPFPVMVGKGAAHCGSGCTLGDLCAELLALAFPAVAIAFGWKWIFPPSPQGRIFAVWVFDFACAFVFGVAFQYFTIVPMRGLPPGKGLMQALKADAASLTAWQIGMYGFMALAHFAIFARVFHHAIDPSMPEFWFMMQLAMLAGFATSYPVNWWLIERGVKEKM
jgi:hypothetical protein